MKIVLFVLLVASLVMVLRWTVYLFLEWTEDRDECGR